MRSNFPFLLLFVLISFIGCKSATVDKDPNKINIVATTGMIADAAASIGGEWVSVEALMGPGVDPHLYKATHGDLTALRSAEVILYNGLHLEGKMGEVFEKLARDPNETIVPVAESIDKNLLKVVDPSGPTYDPHLWFDVALWSNTYTEIAKTLAERDPDHAEFFRNSATEKINELNVLNNWVDQEIASIPAEQRILITAHDAFEYFGSAYNIEVQGLQGISTLSEAGLKDVKELVNLIVERNIKAVFIESSVPVRDINAVVTGCKQKGHDVKIGGTLFSDAMGEEGTEEGNYIGMVRYNVNTIVNALQ